MEESCMSKSIKFRNNTYLDSSSIVHNKEPLNEIINTPIKTSAMNTYYAKKNQENYINSIKLGKGTWLIIGEWRYEGFDASTWTSMINTTYSGASSKYDNDGYVNEEITGLLVNTSNTEKTIYLNLWPRLKDIQVKSTMAAVRIK
jgi:hypothetical protein